MKATNYVTFRTRVYSLNVDEQFADVTIFKSDSFKYRKKQHYAMFKINFNSFFEQIQ
jgi:hypothetical protein